MTDPTPPIPPAPPTHEAVAAVLIAAADGAPLLADQPVSELHWGLQRVDTASGWQLGIWWRQQIMGPLHSATAPDGGRWIYGCGRWPDWLAGSEAVVLDPLAHLLTADQRQRLQDRLLSCNCWPAVELPSLPEPPLLSEIFPEGEVWDLMPS
jgi:hypothetical protein